MNVRILGVMAALLLLTVVQSAHAVSEPPQSVDEQALAILKRSTEFIARAKSFSFTAQYEFDAVQETGEKIEFGATNKFIGRRPDRLRIETVRRDGEKREVLFDGQEIVLSRTEEKVYSKVRKRGDVGQALDFLDEEIGVPMPLRDFFAPDVMVVLTEDLVSARYGGESIIGDIPCDHLAFRTEAVDYQIWVSRGDQPLPQRIVITYKQEKAQPQFRAQFLSWDMSPKAPDSLFTFKPGEGAEQIPFVARQAAPGEKGGEK